MEEIRVQKIMDKEEYNVFAQENCTQPGYSEVYVKGEDCLHDCHDATQAGYYGSVHY